MSARTVLVAALAAVTVPIAVGATRGAMRMHELHGSPAPAASAPTALPPPWQASGRPLVVFVAGADGTEITDLVPPYSVFAESGAFDLLLVAPERRPVPLVTALLLDAGVDVVPHLSFEEYDREVGRAPDVLVVPYVPRRDGVDRAVVPWVRAHAGDGTLLVTVCAGSELAAEAGLLDDRDATTHPSFHERMVAAYPRVRWIPDRRFVEDGDVITSGGLSSGVHAALAAVRRLRGASEARSVALAVGADAAYLDDPRFVMAPWSASSVLAATFGGDARMGVAIGDDVDALTMAAMIDAVGVSGRAHPVVVARERRAFRTREGLWVVPRSPLPEVPPIEALFALEGSGAAVSAPGAITVVGRGYDPALRALADVDGRAAAAAAADSLLWPRAIRATESAWRDPLAARPIVVGAVTFALVLAVGALRSRRRERATRTAPAGSPA